MIDITLPAPTSVNRIWVPITRKGKPVLVKSSQYARWQRKAGLTMLLAPRHLRGIVHGPYRLTIRAARSRMDLDNLIKAASDLMQKHGRIDDDRLAKSIHVEWLDPGEDGYPGDGNIRVMVEPVG